ncbi:MAG: DUF2911 domain-containing protein [Saprospiraceae bacterium]|nr:DUF2911 domain-containing protein [Saprospiraceae bacterium]
MLQADLPSPRKQMTATMGDLKVVINYGSPSLKGRTIGKEVAPFGEVWRTGANEATSIEFLKCNGRRKDSESREIWFIHYSNC